MFQHVLDLAFHGDKEERKKVGHQNGPEDGHVEHGEAGGQHAERKRPGGRPPKLELGQPPHKRAELVRRCGRQGRAFEFGVDLGWWWFVVG